MLDGVWCKPIALFAYFVVFRIMGKDYDAAVITSDFGCADSIFV